MIVPLPFALAAAHRAWSEPSCRANVGKSPSAYVSTVSREGSQSSDSTATTGMPASFAASRPFFTAAQSMA